MARLPSEKALLVPGGFGENLTTRRLDEDLMCIGDVLRMGGVTAQVTQPRQPCFKLGLHFKDPTILRGMLRSGRNGWYLRVLGLGRSGSVDNEDRLPQSNLVGRALEYLFGSHATVEEIAERAELSALAPGLRDSARAALKDASRTNRGALPETESERTNVDRGSDPQSPSREIERTGEQPRTREGPSCDQSAQRPWATTGGRAGGDAS